jgi:hypothetical protein
MQRSIAGAGTSPIIMVLLACLTIEMAPPKSKAEIAFFCTITRADQAGRQQMIKPGIDGFDGVGISHPWAID